MIILRNVKKKYSIEGWGQLRPGWKTIQDTMESAIEPTRNPFYANAGVAALAWDWDKVLLAVCYRTASNREIYMTPKEVFLRGMDDSCEFLKELCEFFEIYDVFDINFYPEEEFKILIPFWVERPIGVAFEKATPIDNEYNRAIVRLFGKIVGQWPLPMTLKTEDFLILCLKGIENFMKGGDK